jgi:hypothetical protein
VQPAGTDQHIASRSEEQSEAKNLGWGSQSIGFFGIEFWKWLGKVRAFFKYQERE